MALSDHYPADRATATEQAAVDALHVLYRFFDAEGVLLYVGITCNPGTRMMTHARQKSWWSQVASSTMQHLDSREALEDAERLAIRSEFPKYNLCGARWPATIELRTA